MFGSGKWDLSKANCLLQNLSSARCILCLVFAAFASLQLGCVPKPAGAVVIYSAADREYAEPILGGFSRRNEKVTVTPVFDVESSKTLGLVTRIEQESQRPRCDLFWNNEILHTLRLQEAGLLSPVKWDLPADWPANMRASDSTWVGFAARARILIVNRNLLPTAEERPTSVMDLADPKWKNRCAIAMPLFGSTATHFAVLDDRLGSEEAADLFRKIRDNAIVQAGNKQVAQAVSSGQLAFGLTDTDDAMVEIAAGLPVEIVFPDQLADQPGTLLIPNTLAVIKGGPNPTAAGALANYLISEDTEGRLAMGPSAQVPLRPNHPQKSRAIPDEGVKWMDANYETAAKRWSNLYEELRVIFRGE